jgi:hypothetical protein
MIINGKEQPGTADMKIVRRETRDHSQRTVRPGSHSSKPVDKPPGSESPEPA